MNANEKTLNTFATRVRQMILRFNDMKKENDDLYTMIDERDAEIKKLQKQLAQAQTDYNSLKMAKMIEITDGDMEGARKRLSKLIRDVNKCITLLSEK
ncbi:MAG: hypothetical protein MRZ50_07820 [Prevotella sp.]|jgi:predicted nuclease with TOPRIM domain|nr:hypothetical protein [Prevotella sp.]